MSGVELLRHQTRYAFRAAFCSARPPPKRSSHSSTMRGGVWLPRDAQRRAWETCCWQSTWRLDAKTCPRAVACPNPARPRRPSRPKLTRHQLAALALCSCAEALELAREHCPPTSRAMLAEKLIKSFQTLAAVVPRPPSDLLGENLRNLITAIDSKNCSDEVATWLIIRKLCQIFCVEGAIVLKIIPKLVD